MSITRRDFLQGTASLAALAGAGLMTNTGETGPVQNQTGRTRLICSPGV